MSFDRIFAVASVIVVSGTMFVSRSQDSIPIIQIIEAVGKYPSASTTVNDSIVTPSHHDTISTQFLDELFSVFEPKSMPDRKADADVDNAEAFSVLDFMTDAYDGKSFYDTGGWDDIKTRKRLQIYEGELPAIDQSQFMRPVKGKITSSFGARTDSDKMHYGVDLAGKTGDTVIVALPGKVMKCGYDKKGYGWYVCVADSTGFETRYAHLSKVLVKRGDLLPVKAPLGLVGSTGNSSGPHLHFEMRYKGQVVNPILFILK